MNESEARRERAQHRSQQTPDHVREGKTLPEQIEGDHAYRDDPPEYDPSLWATHSVTCMVCETEFPVAASGESRDRLTDGRVDVGTCPECDRDVPVVKSSVTLPSRTSGWDDSIYVVLRITHDDYGASHTTAAGAYRDEERAREVAEEKREPFMDTQVACVGLEY